MRGTGHGWVMLLGWTQGERDQTEWEIKIDADTMTRYRQKDPSDPNPTPRRENEKGRLSQMEPFHTQATKLPGIQTHAHIILTPKS